MKRKEIEERINEKGVAKYKIREGVPDARWSSAYKYTLYMCTDGYFQMPGTYGKIMTVEKTLADIENWAEENL